MILEIFNTRSFGHVLKLGTAVMLRGAWGLYRSRSAIDLPTKGAYGEKKEIDVGPRQTWL
jgi:hypothetical protein